jgi:hypothetical protein
MLKNAVIVMLGWATAASAWAQNAPPVVEHSPVVVGIRGQPITVRANVRDDGQSVKDVAIYCAASQDAAPFKLPMRHSGAGIFAGTIPASVFASLDKIYYYVEARDRDDATTETPWYTVEIRSLDRTSAPPTPAGSASVAPPPPPEETGGWSTSTKLVSGAIVVGGIALALAGGGGDDDEDAPSTNGLPPQASTEGTYSGSATTCVQPPASNLVCSSASTTIRIDAAGRVTSSDLHSGETLQAQLSGTAFVMSAPVSENGLTGSIEYIGNIVDNRIVGTIQGSASATNGVTVYSGNFSAIRP